MKTHLTFTLLLMVGFISTAQSLKFDSIEDAIAIKPSLTFIDFSDKSFVLNANTFSFNTYTYSQNITKQRNAFDMNSSITEIVRDDFVVFSHKDLKNNFFQDYTITYRRGELERLLPRSLDPSYYNPCIGGD